MNPVRTIAVDYLNTLPLRVGLGALVYDGTLTLELAHPGAAAEAFAAGHYDLGLLPAAASLRMPDVNLIGNQGIVCKGAVGSVGIFSEAPLGRVRALYLDHDSRSSVLLARILLRHHWRLSPKLLEAPRGYRRRIAGTTAGVIIGDPAIDARAEFPYYYDLGEAWYEMTGLPFVFAAWLGRGEFSDTFVRKFDVAQRDGIALRPQLAKKYQAERPHYDLLDYFTRQLRYRIDAAARAGLEEFLQLGAAELDVRVPALA